MNGSSVHINRSARRVLAAGAAFGLALGLAACDRSSNASPPVKGSMTAAPAKDEARCLPELAMQLNCEWPELVEGDNLLLAVRLSCPRALHAATTRPAAPDALPGIEVSTLRPEVPTAWADSVTFTVGRLSSTGQRETVFKIDPAREQLLPQQATANTLPVLAQRWLIVPPSPLPAGEYVIEAAWGGTLRAQIVVAVGKASNALDKRHRSVRRAMESYLKQDFAEARRLGRAALPKADQPLTPEIAECFEMVADSCLAMDDIPACRTTLSDLLKRLPSDGEQAESVRDRLKFLDAVAPRPGSKSRPK